MSIGLKVGLCRAEIAVLTVGDPGTVGLSPLPERLRPQQQHFVNYSGTLKYMIVLKSKGCLVQLAHFEVHPHVGHGSYLPLESIGSRFTR